MPFSWLLLLAKSMNERTTEAPSDSFLDSLNRAWTKLEILRLPRIQAVARVMMAFEGMLAVVSEIPILPAKFVGGLNGLNCLLPRLIDACPTQNVTREELKQIISIQSGSRSLEPAIDALEFASLYAFSQYFSLARGAAWQCLDRYSAVASVTDDTLFKSEYWAYLVHEELATSLFGHIKIAMQTAEDSIKIAEKVLEAQTSYYPMKESWEINGYSVGDWKKALLYLITAAIDRSTTRKVLSK
jgi:hypothetical protein